MTTEPIVEQGPVGGPVDGVTDEQLVAMLVDRARGDGLKLTGEGGLLQQLNKTKVNELKARLGAVRESTKRKNLDARAVAALTANPGCQRRSVLDAAGTAARRSPPLLPLKLSTTAGLMNREGHQPSAGRRSALVAARPPD